MADVADQAVNGGAPTGAPAVRFTPAPDHSISVRARRSRLGMASATRKPVR